MEQQNKYPGIVRFLMIAVVFIIAIHTSPLSSINKSMDYVFVRIIARVAMPIAFVTLGYLIQTEKLEVSMWVKKLTLWYLLSIIFYLPVMLYVGYFKDGFSIGGLITDILFNGTVYHLWFFPAAILGIGLISFMKHWMDPKKILWVTVILYGIGLLGDSYYRLVVYSSVIDGIYAAMFQIFDYTRNGFFYAPIFIFIGSMVAQEKEEKERAVTPYWAMIGFLISLAVMIIEGTILHAMAMQRNDTMYLALVPCVYFLFHVILGDKRPVEKDYGRLPLLVYLLNPMMIVVVRAVARLTQLTELFVDNSLIYFLVVTVLTFGISYLIDSIGNLIQLTLLLKLNIHQSKYGR